MQGAEGCWKREYRGQQSNCGRQIAELVLLCGLCNLNVCLLPAQFCLLHYYVPYHYKEHYG